MYDPMNIPPLIAEAVKEKLETEGGFVKYLGLHEGKEVYLSAIEGEDTGFPDVFLYDGNEIEWFGGFDALDIASLFLEDA